MSELQNNSKRALERASEKEREEQERRGGKKQRGETKSKCSLCLVVNTSKCVELGCHSISPVGTARQFLPPALVHNSTCSLHTEIV